MFARFLAFCLVHFARTKTLSSIERGILSEVIRRHNQCPDTKVSQAEVESKIQNAERHLHNTLEAWQR